jgi:hypothetical protein
MSPHLKPSLMSSERPDIPSPCHDSLQITYAASTIIGEQNAYVSRRFFQFFLHVLLYFSFVGYIYTIFLPAIYMPT